MACPVLISPSCIVVGKAVGAMAGTAACGALNGIAAAIESGVSWMVTQTPTWWVQVPSRTWPASRPWASSSSGSCRWLSPSPCSG